MAVVDNQNFKRRAKDILSRCPNSGPIRGAEIGVCHGKLAEAVLCCSERTMLYLVDSWGSPQRKLRNGRNEGMSKAVGKRPEYHLLGTRWRTDFASHRRAMLIGDSVAVAGMVPDRWLDFAYIDANHTREGVSGDIATWWPKVKPSGLLCGHDYGLIGAVTRVVDQIAEDHGLEVEQGACSNWFIRLPAE